MITDFLTYLSKEDKKAFYALNTYLLTKLIPEKDNHALLDELSNVLELEHGSILDQYDGIDYFTKSSLRIKRVVFIEVATMFQQLGVLLDKIKEVGLIIGLSEHESDILASWTEDYCEFMETGYMFINSKI